MTKRLASMHSGTRRVVRSSLVVVLVAALVMTAAVVASGALAADANKDSVEGGFEDFLGEKIGLSAQSGPSGEDPSGHESVTVQNEFKLRSVVTCLAVDGNRAAWGTVVTESASSSLPVGTEFVEVGLDGGPGGAADRWNFFDDEAEDCAHYVSRARKAPAIASGNISVHDAQP